MPYFIRSGSLSGFSEAARASGLDAARLLREFGLPRSCLLEPDLMVPIESVCRLLEAAATRSGIESFGLLMAESRKVSNLGPLGLFAREQPTLRDALGALTHYARLLNESLHVSVEEDVEVAIVREELLVGDVVAVRQATELAIGVVFKLMRSFLGADWKPHRVCFVHDAPVDRSVHLRMFGRDVLFGAEFNGIVCATRELGTANPSADSTIAKYARQLLEKSRKPTDTDRYAAQIRQLVVMQLSSGQCTVERVAQLLRVDRRTIHRRLLEEDCTFSEVVDTVRRELVGRYLAEEHLTLAQIASLLGFAAPSGLSRWYKQHFGTTASAARGRRTRPAHAD